MLDFTVATLQDLSSFAEALLMEQGEEELTKFVQSLFHTYCCYYHAN